MRPVRLFHSALADVRYVFGYPIAIPFRRNFKTDADHKAELERLQRERQRVEADEERRWLIRTGRDPELKEAA